MACRYIHIENRQAFYILKAVKTCAHNELPKFVEKFTKPAGKAADQIYIAVMNTKKQAPARKIIADNRKARYNFEILEVIEAGIVLAGTEVKSLRVNQANIAESYASYENDAFWLINSYIPEYTQGNRFNHDPRRLRKLLLSQKQIVRLANAMARDGMTVVPLKLYFNERGMAKMEIALARGKKLHDKRETEKNRDWNREKSRLLRDRG